MTSHELTRSRSELITMKGINGSEVNGSNSTKAARSIHSSSPIEKRLYTLKEAALYLGRSVDGLREVIWARKLPIVRDGRKIWLDIRDLEAFVTRNKSAA